MEGVSILEKQDNHNSKHTIDSLKTKRRENQYNTAQNQTTKGKRQRRNVKSMGKQKWQYISIITLNANGLNAPFKRHRLDFFFFLKSLQCCASKRPTLGQRTLIDWKWEDRKRYFILMEITRKLGAQYSLLKGFLKGSLWQYRLSSKTNKKLKKTT